MSSVSGVTITHCVVLGGGGGEDTLVNTHCLSDVTTRTLTHCVRLYNYIEGGGGHTHLSNKGIGSHDASQ